MNIFLLYFLIAIHNNFFSQVTSGAEGTSYTPAPVVQMEEQRTSKPYYAGSIPASGTKKQEAHKQTKEEKYPSFTDEDLKCVPESGEIIDIHCNEKD